jgi:NAD(P)H-quinone oxidoreductase subunit 4
MLSPLIYIPILGALLIALSPFPGMVERSRTVTLAILGMTLGWGLALAWQFDVSYVGLQFQENLPWIESLGLAYQLGLDGLSLPLVLLNSFITAIAVYCTGPSVERPRLYYSLILLIVAGVAGAFLSANLLLFFLFYELELIPLYLLIGIWGGQRRGYAATKFLLYTAVSGILILAAFLGIAWFTDSFGYETALQATSGLPIATQIVLLVTLLVGFGIKIPLVPLHTWLPDAHVEASTSISMILAGVLLKLGTYGLLKFGLGLFPEAWKLIAPGLAIWAVVSVLYGALTAIAQTDMKKMVAFSSVGHMGYVLLAAAAATPLSVLGSLLQMISHGLISALLFLLVGVVQKKTGTRDIDSLRGLLAPERGLPVIGGLMILGVMASAGIPGMVGFISEFIVFRGSFPVFPVQTILCMVGTGLTAVYFLLLVNRTFFGRLPESLANLPRVKWAERIPGFVLATLIVFLGLQPSWMVNWSQTTTTALVKPVAAAANSEPIASTELFQL